MIKHRSETATSLSRATAPRARPPRGRPRWDRPLTIALLASTPALLALPSVVYAESPAVEAAHVELKNRAPLSSGEVPPDVNFAFGELEPGTFGLRLEGGLGFGMMMSGVPGGWWGGSALLIYTLSDWPRTYVGLGPAGGSAALEVTQPDTGGEMPGATWALDARVGVDYGIGFAEVSVMSGTMSQSDANHDFWRGVLIPRVTFGFRVGP